MPVTRGGAAGAAGTGPFSRAGRRRVNKGRKKKRSMPNRGKKSMPLPKGTRKSMPLPRRGKKPKVKLI